MVTIKLNSTSDIKIPKRLIDQVIGQDEAVEVIKKAAQQRRHVLLIGEPGTGKCVGKDTTIVSEDGPVKAETLFKNLQDCSIEIAKGYETYLQPTKDLFLYTLDNRGKISKKAVKAAYKGIRKKAIKVSTYGGSDFVVSGEHPILSIRDGKLAYLPSEELKEGCFIASIRKIPESNSLAFPRNKLKNLKIEKNNAQFIGKNGVKSLQLVVPEVISKELAYFVGICVAEARWQGNLVIFNSDENIKKFIIDTLIKEFNYPAEYILNLKTGIFLRKSRTLAQILNSCFGFPLETTKQSSRKKVPSVMFSCSNDLIYSFLSGVIDGDGYLGKRGFELTSSSKELIDGITILLLKLGIHSRTRKSLKYASNTKLKIKRVYYRLSISDSHNILNLFENLELYIKSKRDNIKFFTNKKSNTNVDIIPSIGKQLYELKKNFGATFNDLDEYHATFFKFSNGKRNISRSLAQGLVNKFKNLSNITGPNKLLVMEKNSMLINLDLIVNSDIFWDRIKNMSLVEEDMYDFEVEDTHNFLVSFGIVVHNSMLGLALAELLPMEKLVDIMTFPNPNDENMPLIRTIPAGQGRDLVAKAKLQSMTMFKNQNIIIFILVLLAMFAPWWVRSYYKSDIMFAAFFLGGMVFLASFIIFLNLGKRVEGKVKVPRVIVDNYKKKQASFNDATGAHAGALLGDVLHDPFQSGGLGTPAHERVVAGMIHKSHMGVLFIDEIATLQPATQQELLSALQERKFAITGQSERSAGAMVRTEPVPCDFVLVAAGNLETVKHMHPALRSRISGYGYEVYMNDTIPDTPENRDKIAIFVAQEVTKDKKIPHFSKEAIEAMIEEARRRANRKGHLTLRLRELGGLIRAAGDLALEQKSKLVMKKQVIDAKKIARTLEQQLADKYIEQKKEYEIIVTTGKRVGRVNGLAVIGVTPPYSGIILPIESEVTPGGKEGEIIATGKLGEIAKEAIKNVTAIIKKYFGEDLKEKHDIYVQFLQTYEGVEGDSASIAVATSVISAFKKVPVKQDTAMTGSLSVRGEVLPIGGVTAKVEAAIEAGIKNVVVPKTNLKDIIISPDKMKKINIIPVETITDVLKVVIDWSGKQRILRQIVAAD